MSEVKQEIDTLVEAGMSAKFIAATLGVPYEWAQAAVEERECLEIEKQYCMMGNEDE